jgi:transmembrane sensor
LRRWHAQPIVCAPEVAGLQVVGAYPLRNVDRALAALQASLPVRLLHEGGTVRIVAAPVSPASASPDAAITPPRRLE